MRVVRIPVRNTVKFLHASAAVLPQRPNCTKLFRPRRGVSERYRVTTAHNGSAPRFQRTRSGYDPVAVNHYIAELVLRQQAQHCEIETLKAEIASLKDENAALKDTSPSAQAVTDRMAKMLRLAVDEVFQMQSEARAEAATLVSAARMRRKRSERRSEKCWRI